MTDLSSPTILTVKEENEQRQKLVVFNVSKVISAKIGKLTSMLGKLTTEKRQSKPFRPRVYQGRG